MACRVRGAVVGVAILLTAIPCSTRAVGYANGHGGGSTTHVDSVKLSPHLAQLRQYLYSRGRPDSVVHDRLQHNIEVIRNESRLPITIEHLHKDLKRKRLTLAPPKHALGDRLIAEAAALSLVSTVERVRRTGVRPEFAGGPEGSHENLVSALQHENIHEVIRNADAGIATPLGEELRFRILAAFLHDSMIEDNAQKKILEPSYEPTLLVVQPHELADLLEATQRPGQSATQSDELIAAAAIARRKLNTIFHQVVTTNERGHRIGIGSAALWLSKPVFDSASAPVFEELPFTENLTETVAANLQNEIQTACLTSRLLKHLGSTSVARIKQMDAVATIDPAHILQNDELTPDEKTSKLTVAAARRWFLVNGLRQRFDSKRTDLGADMFLVAYQDSYFRYVPKQMPKLMGDDWRAQVLKLTEAIGRFDTKNWRWRNGTLGRYLTQLAHMDAALDGIPLGNQ